MSFHTRMSLRTAEALSSFLITAAERFREDATLCRSEAKLAQAGPPSDLPEGAVWCPPDPVAMESLAKQFDAQERQARAYSEQFSEAYENPGSWVIIPEVT